MSATFNVQNTDQTRSPRSRGCGFTNVVRDERERRFKPETPEKKQMVVTNETIPPSSAGFRPAQGRARSRVIASSLPPPFDARVERRRSSSPGAAVARASGERVRSVAFSRRIEKCDRSPFADRAGTSAEGRRRPRPATTRAPLRPRRSLEATPRIERAARARRSPASPVVARRHPTVDVSRGLRT